MFKILLVCGGPSLERGISLNSARSVYDNIGKNPNIDIKIVFVSFNMEKYIISQHFLYSNTPSDFDFKLKTEGIHLSEDEFISELKSCDIVFPIIHGKYGEDGTIQALMESLNVKYVASSSASCHKMYNKEIAGKEILQKNGFYTIPKLIIDKNSDENRIKKEISEFFEKSFGKDIAEVIIKPVEGGSSIGVEKANSADEAVEKALELLNNGFGNLTVEEMCKGTEFTVIILENDGKPVALIPTEIECRGIFTQEKKYLPSVRTHYYCPPRFSEEVIRNIRKSAEELFKIAGAKNFLRIDGWVLDNGNLYFSDFNPISGMEQNSFMFQQGAKIGLNHHDMITYILEKTCKSYGIEFPANVLTSGGKKNVYVLMGGWTSERQVSLMSGTNVWLKLLNSKKYKAVPFLLFKENDNPMVMELPYAAALNHTVEEIMYQYNNRHESQNNSESFYKLSNEIRKELGIENRELCSVDIKEATTLEEFLNLAVENKAYVFLGLHGGFGENGTIQSMLEEKSLSFNGSGSKTSKICMDKYCTGELITKMNRPGVRTAGKKKLKREQILEIAKSDTAQKFWRDLTRELKSESIVIKPNSDGCSTGVIVLENSEDFKKYVNLISSNSQFIEPNTFKNQGVSVALSSQNTDEYLFEEYIKTGNIYIENGNLVFEKDCFYEMTVGVLERNGVYHSLNPSITIAENNVLSVQEKFQGGMGVNITPPPQEIISSAIVDKIKGDIEETAKTLGINDYSRIDIFVHSKTGETVVIEANTLPGLSPSTVLFQQGAKEENSILPIELLETIINY